jgi:hypothetical protein
VLEYLASSLAPVARVLGNALTSRTAVGAFAGGAFTGAALLVGGAIWGAVVRAAPCYGGGEPPPLAGAAFGAFACLFMFGWWAVPAGASVGAVLAALLSLRPKQSRDRAEGSQP